ncbi:MAG: DUF5671 domain-containing protein [Actinomycetota bacterium]
MSYSGPRSVFVYVASFLTLYLSAIGMAILTWGLADHWFQDPLERFSYNYPSEAIRTGIAMVVVAYPAFLLLTVNVRRKIASGELPERSGVKRILTYVTLFVIALTAIIDLISIIYQFLGGELTARFATKAVGILLIAGFVFLYYLGELREPKQEAAGKDQNDEKQPPEGDREKSEKTDDRTSPDSSTRSGPVEGK